MSVEDALANVPTKASQLFAESQAAAGDAAKATATLDSLKQIYEKAQADKDTLDIECKNGKSKYAHLVGDARAELMNVETLLTLNNDRMHSVQVGNEQTLAELEAIRVQYTRHKKLCEVATKHNAEQREHLMKDLPIARTLYTEITASCGPSGGTPPALELCSLPDGTFITTFKDAAQREKVAKLGGPAERMISMGIDRAVQKKLAPPASLLQTKRRRRSRRRHSASASFLQTMARHNAGKKRRLKIHDLLERTELPSELCTAATAPECSALADELATSLGAIQDLLDELSERGDLEDDHCRRSLEGYDIHANELARQSSDANVMLANAVSEKGDLDEQRRQKQLQFKDLSVEADHKVGTCAQEISDLDATLCSVKKLRKEVEKGGTKATGFMGDCEVTEWVRGPCTKMCGGGVQNITREVISKPAADAKCPPLSRANTCNPEPCPIDGEMSRWTSWTECSRACGGGTRLRHRTVVTAAENGGLPLGETIQEELCNTKPCDADCELSIWTAWTNCSKACGGGHNARTKQVLHPEVGSGVCPQPESPQRREMKTCNEQECPASPLPKCASKKDIVLLLDSSGSLGADGFEKVKAFAGKLVGRLNIAPEGAAVGAVAFAETATELTPMSTTATDVTSKVTGATWLKTSTNTAEALVKAEDLLLGARPGVEAVVVIVTDGMPQSMYLTSTVLERLKRKGVRIAMVTVGHLDKRGVRSMVSWPSQENIVRVDSASQLDDAKVTKLIANLCPVLA